MALCQTDSARREKKQRMEENNLSKLALIPRQGEIPPETAAAAVRSVERKYGPEEAE